MSVYVDQELADFVKGKKTMRLFQKGDVICSQGQAFDEVYLLESGYVKIYDIDEGGNERTINIFSEGSIFPNTWLLKVPPEEYYYYYEAISEVSCYVVDTKRVHDFVRARPKILMSMADHLVRSYVNLAGRLQNLEKSRVSERLEFVLFHLAVRLGETEGKVTRIDAIITQEDIAGLAGVTRESMSLEINQRLVNRPYWRDNNSTYINLEGIDSSLMPKVLKDEL